jgi:hypothetical protein
MWMYDRQTKDDIPVSGQGLWWLMPLSTIFQLYCGSQFLLVEETVVPGENNRHWQTISQIMLYRVYLTRVGFDLQKYIIPKVYFKLEAKQTQTIRCPCNISANIFMFLKTCCNVCRKVAASCKHLVFCKQICCCKSYYWLAASLLQTLVLGKEILLPVFITCMTVASLLQTFVFGKDIYLYSTCKCMTVVIQH